ncbi:MAG: hypothetical protein AAFP16_10030 [Pseudomonadota bacterium]
MKKSIMVSVLCASLAATQAHAGSARATTTSNGGSDTAAIVLIIALGAMLFGANRNRGRAGTATTKSPDSQF